MRRLLGVLAAAALAAGCGEDRGKFENVPLEKVPEPVMKSAKGALPDVTFDQSWKKPNGNYEVRGKTKTGKVRDVQVTPDGTVVEVD